MFEHKEKIGAAIWEFLWCISRTTKEEVDEKGIVWGIVFGGKPVKHEEIAEQLGSSARTVQRNMARLKEHNYIDTIRLPYGEVIKVRHSKKWRNAKSGMSERERYDKSGIPDLADMTDMAYLYDKNGTSNKILYSDNKQQNDRYDLTHNNANQLEEADGGVPSTGGSVPQEIPPSSFERIVCYLANKMGQMRIPNGDLVRIQNLLNKGIDEHDIIAGIDIAFTYFRPKFSGDRIRSITYCEPLIWEMHQRRKEQPTAQEGARDSIHRTSMKKASGKNSPSITRGWNEFEYGHEED